MERYANFGGNSGIAGYSTAPDSITVYFSDGSAYLYTSRSAGAGNIEYMKSLAQAGQGLNAFINAQVKKRYARRLR